MLCIQIVEAKSLFSQTLLLDIDTLFPYRELSTAWKKMHILRSRSMFCWTLPLNCQYRFRGVHIENVWSHSYENNIHGCFLRIIIEEGGYEALPEV
jgi:hypothetical protein